MTESSRRGSAGGRHAMAILVAGAAVAMISTGLRISAAEEPPAGAIASSNPASQPTERPLTAGQAGRIYSAGKGYSLVLKSNHEVSELDANTEKVRGTIQETVEAYFDVSAEAGADGSLRLVVQAKRLILTAGKGSGAVALDTDKPADLESFQAGQTLKAIKLIRLTAEISRAGGIKVVSGSRPFIERLYPEAKGSQMAESVIAQVDGWLVQCLLEPAIYLSADKLAEGSQWQFQRKIIPSPMGGGEPFDMLETASCKAGSIKDDAGKAVVIEISGTCKPIEDTQGIEYTIKRSGRVELDANSGKMRFHRIATSYEGVVPVKEAPGKLRGSIVAEAKVEESAAALERLSKPAPLPEATSMPASATVATENSPSSRSQPVSAPAGEKTKFEIKFKNGDRFVLAAKTEYSFKGKDPANGESQFEFGCDMQVYMPVAVAAESSGFALTVGVKRAVLKSSILASGKNFSGSLDTADEKTISDPVCKPFAELLNAICKLRLDKSGKVAEVCGAGKFTPMLTAAGGNSAVPLIPDNQTQSAPASDPATKPAEQKNDRIGPEPEEWFKQTFGKLTDYLPGRPVAVGEVWDIERKFLVVTYPGAGLACIVRENIHAGLESVQDSPDGKIAIVKLAGKAEVISAAGDAVFPGLTVAGELKFNLDSGRMVSVTSEITGSADMRDANNGPVVSKNLIKIVCQTVIKKDKAASQPAGGEK